LHHDVNAEVFADALCEDGVGLYAERVEDKLVRATAVVEGVEPDADPVVLEYVVALRDGRAHLARLVEGVEGQVEELRVVADANLRRLRGRRQVAGAELYEVLEDGRRFPDLFVELAVDDRRLVEAHEAR